MTFSGKSAKITVSKYVERLVNMRTQNEIIVIDDMEDFDDRYDEFLSVPVSEEEKDLDQLEVQNKVNKRYIYRGVSNAEQLVPTLVRSFKAYEGDVKRHNAKKIEMYENNLFFKAERNGSYALENVDSVFDFISTMRHYNLPTRLIDWTRDPDVALMFSVFSKKTKDIKPAEISGIEFDFENYYYIFKMNIKEHICLSDIPCCLDDVALKKRYVLYDMPYAVKYQLMLKTVKQLFDKDFPDEDRKELIKEIYLHTNSEYLFNSFYDKQEARGFDKRINKTARKFMKGNTILFIEPRYSNRRVASQRGLFQFPVNLNGNVIKKQIVENAQVLAINKNLRMNIISKLEGRGVNYYNLMPDLQGVCTYAHSDVENWFKIKNPEVKK